MPSASKQSASHVEDMGIMEGRYEELGGYTVGFETLREHADGMPLFRGLPGHGVLRPARACPGDRGRHGFSPTGEYEKTMEVVAGSLAALQS
jgi:hypothetical protein